MCVIIDMNVAHRVLTDRPSPEYDPVHDGLFRQRTLRLAVGGTLRREYFRSREVTTMLRVLDQAGVARIYDDVVVDAETATVVGLSQCVSDDPHVIALARVSGARVICSEDKRLHADIKNPRLLRRVGVYQHVSHSHLLRNVRPCR